MAGQLNFSLRSIYLHLARATAYAEAMQFSLKRSLTATGYVALVAAALAAPNEALTLLLWAISLSALCYAVTAIFCNRHPTLRPSGTAREQPSTSRAG